MPQVELSREVERSLTMAAREINVRLDKARQIESKADDHRLAAALRLAEAQIICKANKLPFKGWVETNVQYSYDEVRKLAAVGASDNPQQALEDLRTRTRTRMRQHRARGQQSQVTARIASFPKVMANLPRREAKPLLEQAAHEHGLEVLSGRAAEAARRYSGSSPLVTARLIFDDLSPASKLRLLAYAAEQLGIEVPVPDKPGGRKKPGRKQTE